MAEDLTDDNKIPGAPKPGVLSLAIKEKASLYAAYMPFIKGGGLFIPTTKPFKLVKKSLCCSALLTTQLN